MRRADDLPTRALTLIADRDAITALRALLPSRAMSWAEAHSVAERQATALLRLTHIAEPPVPQFVIASLPGIVVDWRQGWPVSGMAVRARSHWRIVLRADEPRQRQRFSLAHEFKHVLDDPLIDRLYTHLAPLGRRERTERLCNYFAACLLMPRAWVKRDWCMGIQKTRALARRYYVSEEAMSTRLSEIGLHLPTGRQAQSRSCHR
jgi:IrrE N-terminal-like domain